jgi:hypothetical protein
VLRAKRKVLQMNVAAAFFLDHLGSELEHGRLMTLPEQRSLNHVRFLLSSRILLMAFPWDV